MEEHIQEIVHIFKAFVGSKHTHNSMARRDISLIEFQAQAVYDMTSSVALLVG